MLQQMSLVPETIEWISRDEGSSSPSEHKDSLLVMESSNNLIAATSFVSYKAREWLKHEVVVKII